MYIFYTDGATSSNGQENALGGWAWIEIKDGEVVCTNMYHMGYVTNNICELSAVIDACKNAEANNLENGVEEECTIYTDSAYVVNCYEQKWYKNWQANGWLNSKNQPVANRKLWEELIPFFEKTNYHFEKVAGHSGDKYNELVDRMAVAAKNPNFNIEEFDCFG